MSTPFVCPACGSRETEQLLSLASVPVHVGLLWPDQGQARACPQGPLDLALCSHCGYVWNTSFDIELMQYDQDYDNALHHSPKFAAWEAALADDLVERHDLHGRRLAEIGPGDGRFLATLCIAGANTGIGFEPGHNADRVSELVEGVDITIIDEFADARSLRGHEVDFVAARHVLEHLPDPNVLIETIRGGSVDGGSVYVEVPNFSWALDRGAFEDLMYEHCGYYTVETLAHLLRRRGFVQVRANGAFDGLFASVEAVVGQEDLVDEPIGAEVIDRIRADMGSLAARIDHVDAELTRRREAGQRLAAWGGGARAVGLLNVVGSSDAIACVADINPRKQGTYVPGTGHPIVAPESLVQAAPDAILVVNPVYADEIRAMLDELGLQTDLITM